jgi:hypothetical protein
LASLFPRETELRNGNGEGHGDGSSERRENDTRDAESPGSAPSADDDAQYEDVERRALFSMPDEDEGDEAPVDVVGALSENGVEAAAHDVTLGGYIDTHNRVPAFEGTDGQPYTVDIATDETGDSEQPFSAFLFFIRWAATGAGIMDHVESGDVAAGATEEEARQTAMELSLFEVKAELDAAIARRQQEMEG